MDNKKPLIEKIKIDLKKSGFPLEIEVMNILLKNGWVITPQYHFKDPIEGKDRSVDFLCWKGNSIESKDYERFEVNLVIECKKLDDKQWVLFSKKDVIGRENPEGYIQFVANSKDWMMNFNISLEIDSIHYDKEQTVGLSHYVPFNKTDTLYTALNQAINGLFSKKKHVTDELKMFDFPIWNGYAMFIPIIIVDSNLFCYDTETDDLREVDFQYYRTTGLGKIEESCVVEIIRKDRLNNYLEKLNSEIDYILDYIDKYEPRNLEIE